MVIRLFVKKVYVLGHFKGSQKKACPVKYTTLTWSLVVFSI